jgi:hypothetical protein
MSGARLVRTVEAAGKFVDEVGLALIFPKPDLVLPSLWVAVAGPRKMRWRIEHPDGSVTYDEDAERVWAWKDELAARRLACSGKHLKGRAALISRRILPSLYALTGRGAAPDDFKDAELEKPEHDVASVLSEAGPLSAPEIRGHLGTSDTRMVNRALEKLQKELVATHAGTVPQKHGWPVGTFDILPRRYRSWLRTVPVLEKARETLASQVIRHGEVSVPDLAAALGWPRREASETLERLAEKKKVVMRVEEGVDLWSQRGASGRSPLS